MAKSYNIMFLILILIISIHHLDSTLTPRSQPASPCCQQSPYFSLFSYSPCACPPPATVPPPKRVPVDFKFGELALKPIQILAGASHLALGSILNAGGMPFKFIGSIATNGGQFAETLGYDLKTTGALKVSDGISGITSFLQKFGQPSSVICVVQGDKINVYQPVEEKKKVEKVEKVAKVASPCCQQSPVFKLIPYSPCACQPSAPTAPVGLGIKEMALKPFEILAGASHLALGTILNVGGMPFKFIGTITKNGGEFAETLGYDLKTTGVNKVSNSISSITSFMQKFGQPAPVICVVQEDKINIYQPVAKKEKVEKVKKIEKVEKIEKIEKIEKAPKIKIEPVPYTTTTAKYVPTTIKPTTKYIAPTVLITTVKPPVTYLTEAPKPPVSQYDNMPVSDLPYLDDGSPLNESDDIDTD